MKNALNNRAETSLETAVRLVVGRTLELVASFKGGAVMVLLDGELVLRSCERSVGVILWLAVGKRNSLF